MKVKAKIHQSLKLILKNKFLWVLVCSGLIHIFFYALISKWPGQTLSFQKTAEIIELTMIDEVPKDGSLKKPDPKSAAPVKTFKNQELLSQNELKKSQDLENQKLLKKEINFIGKTSAEILEYKIEKRGQALDTAAQNSGESSSYFKDNQFRPNRSNYDAYAKSGTYGYLEQGGLGKILENTKFYEEVWKRVRRWTGFPKDFLNFRLQGSVRIHALLNHKGELIGDFTKISSENPLLELYSMAILSVALSEPINSQHWVKDTQIPVVFDFNYKFVYTNDGEVLFKDQAGSFSGNTFKLVTTRFIKPEVVQAIENFFHDYFPPVIILPGGVVMIDPILLYQKYNHWTKHGFKPINQVREKEQKNLRKEILAALKNPKAHFINVLNTDSLSDRNSNTKTETNVLGPLITPLSTDPVLAR